MCKILCMRRDVKKEETTGRVISSLKSPITMSCSWLALQRVMMLCKSFNI